MSSVTIVDLKTWVEDMMKERLITNYQLRVSGAVTKGDGYLGEVTFLQVIAKEDQAMKKVYELVVKSAKKGTEFRKKTPIQEIYHREMFMYTKIFPIFEEFQNENTIEDHFDKFAKCYSVCNETNREALILKNLKSAGFEIHDRTSPQNLNHVLFVFRNYGKLHGLSLALKHKKPGLFKSITKNMTDVLGSFIVMGQMEAMFIKDYNEAVEIVRKRGKQDLAKKLEGLGPELLDILTNSSEWIHPCSVILHGDCWNNNMMFKYEDGNKNQPIDMRFIDFQLSRAASPIFDLSYYLYSVADKTVLQNFDFLLQVYHSSLADYLKQYDIDVDDIVTIKELKQQWKKYGKFGLGMAPFIVKIELCKPNEVVDIAESAENGNLSDVFDIDLKERDVYEERIAQILEHWAEEFM